MGTAPGTSKKDAVGKDAAPKRAPAKRGEAEPKHGVSRAAAAPARETVAEPPARESLSSRGRKEAANKRVRGSAPRGPIVSMTSTEAKNGFGRLLDTVARDGRVLITKHNTTQAVVLSAREYESLTRGAASDLDTLTAEFDDLLARLQAPQARAGLRDAFRASPDELSRAAVAAARRDAE